MIQKFKAYDLTENEWINIRTIGLSDDGGLWYLQAWDENENDIDPPYFEGDLGKTWVLLQSTGIKDKNGTEIFEGDILKYKNECRVVEMHDGAWIVRTGEKRLVVKMAVLSGAEIIGNKFQNKDLLEEE